MEEKIVTIINKMADYLNISQMKKLQEVLLQTFSERAIDKGMPIEQVQKLLGHSQIDTTMQYAIVNQTNVKTSHQKFIA